MPPEDTDADGSVTLGKVRSVLQELLAFRLSDVLREDSVEEHHCELGQVTILPFVI